MKKLVALLIVLTATSLIWSNMAAAETTREGHGQMNMPMSGKMKDTVPESKFEYKAVDKDIRAEFKIMSLADMNMKDPNGATHHVMVKLFNDSMNHPIKSAAGKIKVIGPDKKEQINGLKNYNGIYAANFTFIDKGKYGVICLINIDGKKHLFKFWYPHM